MATDRVDILATAALSRYQHREIVSMCSEAYGEDLAGYLEKIGPGWHILVCRGDQLIGHAMWVERRLRVGKTLDLNAAYVELVAVAEGARGKGLGTSIMRTLTQTIAERQYPLAALSSAGTTLYQRLGWEAWRGQLFVRRDGVETPTRGEDVFIHRLPATPDAVRVVDSLSIDWRPGEVW